MSLPNLPEVGLTQEQIESIQNNSANPDLFDSTKSNLGSDSIDKFIGALNKNTGLSKNPPLIKYIEFILRYSTALKTMPTQKETLQYLYNTHKDSLPKQTPCLFKLQYHVISLDNQPQTALTQNTGQASI